MTIIGGFLLVVEVDCNLQWCIEDLSTSPFNAVESSIYHLKKGDKLTIFEHDRDTKIWSGHIKEDYSSALELENVDWIQNGFTVNDWYQYFADYKPAILVRG